MDASYPNPAAREQLQNLRCPLPQWTVHSDWVVQEQLLWVKSCFSLSNVARAAELHWNMCLGEVRAVSLDQSTTALTFTRSAFICPLSTVKPKKDSQHETHFPPFTQTLWMTRQTCFSCSCRGFGKISISSRYTNTKWLMKSLRTLLTRTRNTAGAFVKPDTQSGQDAY